LRAPLVSIGLPVLNGARYLGEALDSLLTQTFEDFELVISDNASTDATEEICRSYAARDARVRYRRSACNLGAGKNFRVVFELARGVYFKWATYDDRCAPTFLARCLAALRSDPRGVLAYPKTTIIDATGAVGEPYEDRLHLQSPRASERYRALFERLGLSNAIYGVMPARVLARTPLLGGYPGADVALLADLALRGRFCEVDERLFFRRFHAACSSCNRAEEAQAAFYDPAQRGRPALATWRHHAACVRSMLSVPLSPAERARVAWIILRRAIWARQALGRELAAALRHLAGAPAAAGAGPAPATPSANPLA
jgi:glycosyltransferase involved in cell wall biosynthesis